MFKHAVCNKTRLGSNIKFIFNSIGLISCNALLYNCNDICHALLCRWINACNEMYIRDGAQIRELILMRDSLNGGQFLDDSESQTVIKFLCTQDYTLYA